MFVSPAFVRIMEFASIIRENPNVCVVADMRENDANMVRYEK